MTTTKIIFSDRTVKKITHPGKIVDMNEKFSGTQLILSGNKSKMITHDPDVYIVDLITISQSKSTSRILGKKYK